MQRSARTVLVVLVIALAAGTFLATVARDDDDVVPLPYEDFRAPTEQPPIASDRPDLWEEPRPADRQP
ncbi:MAG: hypothetical protein R3315_01220 [Woeseiaceae bacterium]|nr:hypothetical protein [Woeseiaceae bacterium]